MDLKKFQIPIVLLSALVFSLCFGVPKPDCEVALSKSALLRTQTEAFAKEIGLHYANDQKPGITRKRKRIGKHKFTFQYFDTKGNEITNAKTLERIRALGIPPGYEDSGVWISPDPKGHLQATGNMAGGKKQYRYHSAWTEARAQQKFNRVLQFGKALPKIRKNVEAALKGGNLTKEKRLALVVHLLDQTRIRVGNEEYAEENESFGLTTLRQEHFKKHNGGYELSFKGKSGKWHEVPLPKTLAPVIEECLRAVSADSPVFGVSSADVNAFLKDASGGGDFTAKDFRTWHGSVLAAKALATKPFQNKKEADKNVIHAVDFVASNLRNTRAVSRKSYIHPKVVQTYLDDPSKFEAFFRHAKDPEATLIQFLEAP